MLGACLITGCNNNEPGKKSPKAPLVLTAYDLDERLKSADSLVVVFYKDPYGEDSMRYTRYYTQVSITATSGIDQLKKQLSGEFKKQEKRINCRGEGKIWCFTNGKVFQTLYFSTRCEDCCYVYLIKDGNFYYTPISDSFTKWLETLKPLTTEPANEALQNDNG